MRVEVWSPDGLEAAGYGALTTIRAAENGDAIALMCGGEDGSRVWLEPDEVAWLVGELAILRVKHIRKTARGGEATSATASAES